MCISMICIYLMKQVNKWQPVELPTSTSSFIKLYAKVKMAPETCQVVKKHYDKSNGNLWDIYGYVKMYICMIYMYFTKQVNRLKLVGFTQRVFRDIQQWGVSIPVHVVQQQVDGLVHRNLGEKAFHIQRGHHTCRKGGSD